MNDKVNAVLDKVLDRFQNGDIPQDIEIIMFPIPNVPSAKWSILNQIIQCLSGTADGRGFRQWQDANRHVKKGAKAFHILVPRMKKEDDKSILIGFLVSPVFRVEDTEGEQLDYQKIELPPLPLMERAKEWGLNVIPIPGNHHHYGYYESKKKTIALATPDEITFFHELSHAAHERIKGKLKNGQDPLQEIVAELSAQVLCNTVGYSGETFFGNSYKYIAKYAHDLKVSPHQAVINVLSDIKQVLDLIIGGAYENKGVCLQ